LNISETFRVGRWQHWRTSLLPPFASFSSSCSHRHVRVVSLHTPAISVYHPTLFLSFPHLLPLSDRAPTHSQLESAQKLTHLLLLLLSLLPFLPSVRLSKKKPSIDRCESTNVNILDHPPGFLSSRGGNTLSKLGCKASRSAGARSVYQLDEYLDCFFAVQASPYSSSFACLSIPPVA